MTSAFLCPQCGHKLNVEREDEQCTPHVVIWCGFGPCPSPIGDEGASGETEWEAYERLKDMMRDEELPEMAGEPPTVEDEQERRAWQRADDKNKI